MIWLALAYFLTHLSPLSSLFTNPTTLPSFNFVNILLVNLHIKFSLAQQELKRKQMVGSNLIIQVGSIKGRIKRNLKGMVQYTNVCNSREPFIHRPQGQKQQSTGGHLVELCLLEEQS